MKIFSEIGFAAACMVAAPAEAKVSPTLRPSAFEAPLLGDDELERVRGGAPSPYALTVVAVKTMADAQSRSDFAGTAAAARLVYDNWWNDVGSQLVVDSFPIR